MDSEYLFVSTDVDGKSRNDPRRRSHVMQQHLRAKAADIAPFRPTSSHVPPSLASGKTRFRLNQNSGLSNRSVRRAKAKLPRPSIIEAQQGHSSTSQTDHQDNLQVIQGLLKHPLIPFGSCRVDPFDVLPVRLDSWDENILDRLINIKRYPWCPLNGENRWCSFALSDALVLHATIFAWSISHCDDISDALTSTWLTRNPNVIQHKVATITLLKERIADSKEMKKDETIAAITLMTMIEVMYGDKDGAVIHLNGLKMLVDLRGGFVTFASDIQLLIQRLISWTDLMASELTALPPAFPPAQVWETSWRTLDQWSTNTPSLGLSLGELDAVSVPHHKVINVLSAIHRLCHEQQQRPLRILSEHARMQRADAFLKVERALTGILHSENGDPVHSFWNTTAWPAVTLVALMFVHHFLRGEGLLLRQFRPLTSELREVLSRMSDDLHEFAFNRALLYWILSVGAILSTHTVHHDYFLGRIKVAAVKYSVAWPEVRILLMDFLWSGPSSDEEYSRVWRVEVEATR